jgi:putative Mg2+ transporter-C (MgtC) family protein
MDWSSLGFVETHTPQHIIFIRIGLAALLGGVIGFEREARNGTAGLRTHMLIATAACLFTLLAFEIFEGVQQGQSSSGGGMVDPIRAIEAVTAGIAFLGAGAIFQQRGSVQGLTTGAGMWLAGAIGVSVALGYYVVALVVAVLALVVLAALRAFSHKVIGGQDAADDGAAPQNGRR